MNKGVGIRPPRHEERLGEGARIDRFFRTLENNQDKMRDEGLPDLPIAILLFPLPKGRCIRRTPADG